MVGERFLTYPGGKGANQAVACAMMGAETLMVGRVGDDIFGPQLLDALRSKGVDVTGVGVTQGVSSGIAVIDIDASTQNRIIQVLGANDTCGPEELRAIREVMDRASGMLLQLEVSPELSLQAAREARSRGKLVMLDPRAGAPAAPGILRVLQCNDSQRDRGAGPGGLSRDRRGIGVRGGGLPAGAGRGACGG